MPNLFFVKLICKMGNSKRHIAFILGTGFSVPAGYPIANKFNEGIKLIIDNKKTSIFSKWA